MCDIILHTRASLSDIQHWAIVQAFSHESHEAIHVTTINQLQYRLYTNKTWSNSLITSWLYHSYISERSKPAVNQKPHEVEIKEVSLLDFTYSEIFNKVKFWVNFNF